MNPETKQCQKCKQEFTIESEDFSFYEKMKVPPPTFCWLCRAQRRMAWRNESVLFKRESSFPDEGTIFSAFHKDVPVKVYSAKKWLSDEWDPKDYARDYDFKQAFFKQFKELLYDVPLKSLNLVGPVDSEYANNFSYPKNCYLVFNGNNSEDCMYSNGLEHVQRSIDCSHIEDCENCYDSFWLTGCTKTFWSVGCKSSYEMYFSRDCIGSNNCVGCVNLRNQSYCIFNEQYTKEDYEKKLEEFKFSSHDSVQKMKKQAQEFWQQHPLKYMVGTRNVDVSGNYIENCKNTKTSFLMRNSEDMKYSQYIQEAGGAKDCHDYTAWGDAVERCYECCGCGIQINNIKFSYNVQESVHDAEYSYMCMSSSYLFGCVGLRNAQYCIFNKQYTKEEYEELVSKIKEHMNNMPYIDKEGIEYKYGEYFPTELSPFAYNDTLAQEYFTLSKEEVKNQNYQWRDNQDQSYTPTLSVDDLPDNINDVDDSIVQEVIECQEKEDVNSLGAFRITAGELQFYRQMNIPLPRKSPRVRLFDRFKFRGSLNIYERVTEDGEKVMTTYGEDRPEKIYSEKGYNELVG